jgi:hypothetical protein
VTILVSEIITRAQDLLSDTSAVRWTSAELIRYINDAQREIATVHPESSSVVANVTLVAGTKQALPAGSIALGRINRNMGVGGATPSTAPRPTSRQLMDAHKPGWHSDTATLVVKHWMVDQRTPRIFYVYPPMSGATIVECEYSVIPTPVAAAGDAITLPDFYLNAILEFVLYRAFSKDIEIPGMVAMANKHYEAFAQALGLIDGGETKEQAS